VAKDLETVILCLEAFERKNRNIKYTTTLDHAFISRLVYLVSHSKWVGLPFFSFCL